MLPTAVGMWATDHRFNMLSIFAIELHRCHRKPVYASAGAMLDRVIFSCLGYGWHSCERGIPSPFRYFLLAVIADSAESFSMFSCSSSTFLMIGIFHLDIYGFILGKLRW